MYFISWFFKSKRLVVTGLDWSRPVQSLVLPKKAKRPNQTGPLNSSQDCSPAKSPATGTASMGLLTTTENVWEIY